MAGGIELAKAYVQIVPSAQGIESSLTKTLSDPASKAGKSAGTSIASGLKSAMGTIGKVTATALTAATGAAVAFGKSAVDAGKQFDSSMSQVAATMGVTVDQIDDLRNFAQEMGRTTAFSASEAADALNYMALAGYDSATAMSTLPTVLNLAAAGGIDLAYASDMITDSQSALGLTLDETVTMVDQMAKASSKSNTSVAQLGEAILTVGGTAQFMQGGTTELATVLGLLADNGIKGSEAGTHLRNMLLKLSSPTDAGATAMEALGISVFDAEGKMRSMPAIFHDMSAALGDLTDEQQIQALSDIFNTRDVAAAQALLKTSSERWYELSDAIDGAWYTEEGFSKALAKAGKDLPSIAGNLEQFGINADAVQWALEASGGSAETFVENLWEAADAGVSMEDIVNALGDDMRTLQNAMDDTTGAAQAMADTQLDNLSGDVTLFQSALEGAKIAVSDELTPSLRSFVKFGTKGLEQVTGAFKEGGLEAAVEAFSGWLETGIAEITAKLPQAMEIGAKVLKSIIGGIMQALPSLISYLPTFLSTAVDLLMQVASGLAASLPDFIGAIMQAMPIVLPQLLEGVMNMIIMLMGLLPTLIPQIITGITNTLTALMTSLSTMIQPLVDSLPAVITALMTALITNLPIFITGLTQFVLSLVEALPGILQTVLEAVSTWMPTLIGAVVTMLMTIVEAIPTIVDALLEKLPEIIELLLNTLGEWIPDLLDAAITLLMALVDAIPTIIEKLTEKLPEIIDTILTAFIDNFDKILDGAITLLMAIVDAIPTIISALVEALPTIITTLVDNLISFLPQLLEAAITLLFAIIDAIPELITALIPEIPKIVTTIVTTLIDHFPDLLEGAIQLFMALVEAIPTIIVKLTEALPEIFNTFVDTIFGPLGIETEGIKELFGGICDFIGGIFSGDWEKAWEGVKSIFKGIWDTLVNIVKAPLNLIIGIINGLIGGINWIIDGINKISFEIPDWVPFIGGKTVGFNIGHVAEIPYLAEGGVLTGPTMMVAGEDGSEAVIPLERNTEWIRKVAAELDGERGSSDELLDVVEALSEKLDRMQIFLDGDRLVGGISTRMDKALGRNAETMSRGVALA